MVNKERALPLLKIRRIFAFLEPLEIVVDVVDKLFDVSKQTAEAKQEIVESPLVSFDLSLSCLLSVNCLEQRC